MVYETLVTLVRECPWCTCDFVPPSRTKSNVHQGFITNGASVIQDKHAISVCQGILDRVAGTCVPERIIPNYQSTRRIYGMHYFGILEIEGMHSNQKTEYVRDNPSAMI